MPPIYSIQSMEFHVKVRFADDAMSVFLRPVDVAQGPSFANLMRSNKIHNSLNVKITSATSGKFTRLICSKHDIHPADCSTVHLVTGIEFEMEGSRKEREGPWFNRKVETGHILSACKAPFNPLRSRREG